MIIRDWTALTAGSATTVQPAVRCHGRRWDSLESRWVDCRRPSCSYANGLAYCIDCFCRELSR